MDLNLVGKNALVCGSSQGIGRAAAKELSLLGANCTLVARNGERLIESIKFLDVSKGQTHDHIIADFSDPRALEEKVMQYLNHHTKGFHILVNNTGGPPAGELIDATEDDFMAAFNAHLLCNHLLTGVVITGMKQLNYGRIINVISTSVKAPLVGLGVSNTIRGAVANWSKTLASELAPFGITVNNVLPGATETQRLKNIITAKAEKSGITENKVTEAMKANIPASRFGQPEEVGAAIAFLATPAAAYVNGINLPVDGGRLKNL